MTRLGQILECIMVSLIHGFVVHWCSYAVGRIIIWYPFLSIFHFLGLVANSCTSSLVRILKDNIPYKTWVISSFACIVFLPFKKGQKGREMLLLSVLWRKYITQQIIDVYCSGCWEGNWSSPYMLADSVLLAWILFHLEDVSFHLNSFHIFSTSVQQDWIQSLSKKRTSHENKYRVERSKNSACIVIMW